jgi:pentose-5-phosphate-3-epimerase
MSSVVAHVDSFTEDELHALIDLVTPYQVELILSVSNDIEVEAFLDQVRIVKESCPKVGVEVMGIATLGKQGEFFDERCIERIRKIKQTYGDMYIQVDGAMHPETEARVAEAGATGIVSGSYIFQAGDAGVAISELESLADKA